ncbi:MAG: hypothetical protein RL648_608 [Verrucomicrobiota bacterium]|jgi:cyclophilin family peptidyl-prolyl cis-trans isomerase
MQRLSTLLLIALAGASQLQAVLVNTRVRDVAFVEQGAVLTLDLQEHFQVYPDPGPVATLSFDLPLQDRNPASTNGLWQVEIAPDTFVELMRYKLADGGSYTSPFEATAGEMAFAAYSVDYQLRADLAPLAVGNFITYARDGAYAGGIIHRSEISVLQGGAYKLHQGEGAYLLDLVETRDAIVFEETVANTAGTLSMARQTALDTATSQFFINLADNTQAFGTAYTVFGELLDKDGDLPVLQQMGEVPVFNLTSYFTNAPFNTIPLFAPFFQDPASYLSFNNITIPDGDPSSITYSWEFFDTDDTVSELEATNRAAFAISIVDSSLQISRTASAGTAAITLTGTASNGQSVSFTMDLIGYSEGALNKFPASVIDPSGWIESSWYGWLYGEYYPYITHANHGPQFVYPDESFSVHFIYDDNLASWLYTSNGLYPNLFIYRLNSWAYYSKGSGDGFGTSRWFYLYGTDSPGWVLESAL